VRLEIPGFSRYYLETEDNRIYSKYYHPMSEHINYGDHDHPVCELSIINDQNEHKIVKKHRLVYSAYHPDEDISDLQINHLDEDSLNNCPENLETCTGKENINWGTCRERISRRLKGRPNLALSQPVKATVVDTGRVEYYPSLAEAQRQLDTRTSITRCCKEGTIGAGRTWEYYYGN
jgi:hypothetical protein